MPFFVHRVIRVNISTLCYAQKKRKKSHTTKDENQKHCGVRVGRKGKREGGTARETRQKRWEENLLNGKGIWWLINNGIFLAPNKAAKNAFFRLNSYIESLQRTHYQYRIKNPRTYECLVHSYTRIFFYLFQLDLKLKKEKLIQNKYIRRRLWWKRKKVWERKKWSFAASCAHIFTRCPYKTREHIVKSVRVQHTWLHLKMHSANGFCLYKTFSEPHTNALWNKNIYQVCARAVKMRWAYRSHVMSGSYLWIHCYAHVR